MGGDCCTADGGFNWTEVLGKAMDCSMSSAIEHGFTIDLNHPGFPLDSAPLFIHETRFSLIHLNEHSSRWSDLLVQHPSFPCLWIARGGINVDVVLAHVRRGDMREGLQDS